MKFESIIFDLDGTLLDSLQGIADAMNILLERMGYPVHTEERYKYFVGEGINELISRALPEKNRDSHNLERLAVEYREIYHSTWPQKSPPYNGIPELLDALSAKNIKMSVLSNKSDDFTNRMVSELLTRWRFEVVRGVRPGGARKPDPASALEIAEITGITPGNTVFVGDSGVDMKTAANAGMYGVGVLWGFREADELRADGADRLIKHPVELPAIIE
ncbi:MAG: HAD family hydrolase [bacterium]|nr:HAD family hydrolase [bacterium]